jgi:hypothetical protein
MVENLKDSDWRATENEVIAFALYLLENQRPREILEEVINCDYDALSYMEEQLVRAKLNIPLLDFLVQHDMSRGYDHALKIGAWLAQMQVRGEIESADSADARTALQNHTEYSWWVTSETSRTPMPSMSFAAVDNPKSTATQILSCAEFLLNNPTLVEMIKSNEVLIRAPNNTFWMERNWKKSNLDLKLEREEFDVLLRLYMEENDIAVEYYDSMTIVGGLVAFVVHGALKSANSAGGINYLAQCRHHIEMDLDIPYDAAEKITCMVQAVPYPTVYEYPWAKDYDRVCAASKTVPPPGGLMSELPKVPINLLLTVMREAKSRPEIMEAYASVPVNGQIPPRESYLIMWHMEYLSMKYGRDPNPVGEMIIPMRRLANGQYTGLDDAQLITDLLDRPLVCEDDGVSYEQ